MVKHIVMWKLKDEAHGNDKATNAKMIKESLEALDEDRRFDENRSRHRFSG